MLGICGIIGKNSIEEGLSELAQMTTCMMHESFYTSGTYTNEHFGLCVGWVNRSEAFDDRIPVWNESKDVCLFFSGENYADKELIGKLISQGHKFDSTNYSYLVHLYEENGEKFFNLLNGWFRGILIDIRNGIMLLFNDRYGMQRTYYYETKRLLYFASEAKALLKACPNLRELDLRSLGEMFSFDCVLENRSLFSNIYLLPPGSVWTFRKGGNIKKSYYFKPETWECLAPLTKETFYNRFKETFKRILPRYFNTGKNIALSLTGGLDTRMILAMMNVPYGSLPCYTFGGMYNDSYDVKISRKIAQLCGQTHQVIEVGKKFLKEFPNLAEKTVFVTDGNMDVSGAADLYVNKIARDIAPLRITGNYGSEILRGTRHLKALPACKGLFEREFEKHVNGASDTLAEHYQGHKVSFAAFKQTHWLHYNRFSLEQSQLIVRSPYLDNELVALMFQAPDAVLDTNELSFRLINDGNSKLGDIITDRGLGGNNSKLFSKVFHYYYEFLFKADYAFNYGMPHWLSKADYFLLAPLHIEKIFLGRHKFYHFRVWFRDELSEYVKEFLLDTRSLNRPYLNKIFAERMILDHTSGRLNYTTEITKLLTIEILQRLMIDNQ